MSSTPMACATMPSARRLREVVSQAYSVKGSELDRILAEGEAAEREAVDLYAFTSVLLRASRARSEGGTDPPALGDGLCRWRGA
jgi:hypothetical protein